MVKNKPNGGNNMISRRMAPAIKRIVAMDLTNFIISIAWSELAIKNAILKIKDDLFNRKKGAD